MIKKISFVALAIAALLFQGVLHAQNSAEWCETNGFSQIAVGDSLRGSSKDGGISATYKGSAISFGGLATFWINSHYRQGLGWNASQAELHVSPSEWNNFSGTYAGWAGNSLTIQFCGGLFTQLANGSWATYAKALYYDPVNCVQLSEPGQTLVLGNDSFLCYNVSARDVTINCAGHAIAATEWNSASCGIYSNASGTKVSNCGISSFSSGICLNGATRAVLSNNSISGTTPFGILAIDVSQTEIDQNTLLQGNGTSFYGSGYGEGNAGAAAILLSGSQGNSLAGNVVYCNGCVALSIINNSNSNAISQNNLTTVNTSALILNQSNANLFAGNEFSSRIDSSETVLINGVEQPLFIWEDPNGWSSGTGVPVAAYLLDSDSSIFEGNALHSQTQTALLLANSSGSTFTNNSLLALGGLLMRGKSDNNTFESNFFNSTGNHSAAITGMPYLSVNVPQTSRGRGPHNNIFSGNIISAIGDAAIFLWHFDYLGGTQSGNNIFCENNITARVWVFDRAGNDSNSYTCGDKGNIYYFQNGTSSWDVYDIVDTNNDSYADIGSDVPFTNSTLGDQWVGAAQDAHPYTLKQGALLEISGNASTVADAPYAPAANQSGEELLPIVPSEAYASLPINTNESGQPVQQGNSPSLLGSIWAAFLEFLNILNKL